MRSDNPSVRDLVEVLSKLPPPVPIDSLPQSREEILSLSDKVECACLQKQLHISDVRRINTGLISALDTTCKDCLKDVHDFAIIVCCRCKKVVARISPCRDPLSGFEFQKRRAYHVERCPRCEPGIITSVVIEKYIYEQERKRR